MSQEISNLIDEKLILNYPVSIELSVPSDNFHVAGSEDFDLFGFGISPEAAIEDLNKNICETYWSFSNEFSIHRDLQRQWKKMKNLISEKEEDEAPKL
jgi:hypothetical protein